MLIESGDTGRKIIFDAGAAGLSSFTVKATRDGGSVTTFSSPTVAELAGMVGIYALTVDEETTIDSGAPFEEVGLQISHAGIEPVFRKVTLFNLSNLDAVGEPTGVPGASESPFAKLGYLYMALRNQIDITGSKKTFYDDDGNAEWEKDLSDDDTTYSESEANAP